MSAIKAMKHFLDRFFNLVLGSFNFLAHLSWKLKCLSSVVCLSVCLSVCPSVFSYFRLLLQNHWANSTKLGTKHPWVEGIQVCSNEGPCPSPRGDNSEIVNLYSKYLKILFSRTTGPITTKLNTKHPWVGWIQVCSNTGPHPFPSKGR